MIIMIVIIIAIAYFYPHTVNVILLPPAPCSSPCATDRVLLLAKNLTQRDDKGPPGSFLMSTSLLAILRKGCVNQWLGSSGLELPGLCYSW